MDKILKQFGENKIFEVVQKSNSFVEVTFLLGLDSNDVNVKKSVQRSIKGLNISTDHFKSIKRLKGSKNRFNKEKLKNLVNECKNYKEILEKLNFSITDDNFSKLKGYLYRHNIDFTHLKYVKSQTQSSLEHWNKEVLSSIVKESNTQNEVLEKMKLRSAGGNFYTLKKYIKLFNLDTSHFTKNYSMMQISNKIPLEKILIEKSNFSTYHLKNRLYVEGLKERKCELCGQGEEWNGKKMSLILDHKNGIHNDNRIENLQIVCPNCNATLDTHCGKNNKKAVQ